MVSEADTNEQEEAPLPEVLKLNHKFFSMVPGSYFRASEREDECYMVTPLSDEETVELPLNGIRRELKIKETSSDHQMLDLVKKALRFVQRIQDGDNFPSKILTGKASWEVTELHRTVAQKRLTMQLITWLSGEEEVITDKAQLDMVADDPANKIKILDAFEGAAKEIGIPVEEKEKILDMINEFAEELAYIEALRGQFLRLMVIESRLAELNPIYTNDSRMFETLDRVTRLANGAFDIFRKDFENIDLHTKHIIYILKDMPATIKNINRFRDDLYGRFWAWRELIEEWELTPAGRSVNVERLVQKTYEFLAQRFLPQDEWELFTQLKEKTMETAQKLW